MNAPESAQGGRPKLKATHRNGDALSKVRQNWYVYFRDGAFTFARYATIHPYPDFFGTAYLDFPSDPNKCWVKSIFGPCGKRLGLSARRAETAQKARFPRYSETGRTAPPPRIRPVNTERVEIVFQGWRAKYPPPCHEASRRREMRFHRVIISLESRISLERRRGARRDAFGNYGPPQVCLGRLRHGERQTRSRFLPITCPS